MISGMMGGHGMGDMLGGGGMGAMMGGMGRGAHEPTYDTMTINGMTKIG